MGALATDIDVVLGDLATLATNQNVGLDDALAIACVRMIKRYAAAAMSPSTEVALLNKVIARLITRSTGLQQAAVTAQSTALAAPATQTLVTTALAGIVVPE